MSGERRVAQPVVPGADDRYAVFEGTWPHVVVARDAAPRPTARIVDGSVVLCRAGRDDATIRLPQALAPHAHVRLAHRVAWVIAHPTRGKVRLRFARVDLDAGRLGAVHELEFLSNVLATTDQRFAIFDEPAGVVHVFDESGGVGSVTHQASECWGDIALWGDDVAVVSHRRGKRPGALVSVGWAELRAGEVRASRRFALQTQGATSVCFLEGTLAVHQYSDVTLIEREALRTALPGELMLGIEDVATTPPPAASTAEVAFVGATTGFGFVQSESLGRLRFQCDAGTPVSVGDVIALDVVEGGVVQRWHRLDEQAKRPDARSRCLDPVPMAEFEELDPGALAHLDPSPMPPVPDSDFCVSVCYGAYLSDDDEDTPIVDEAALRSLDGQLERSGDLLDLVPIEQQDELDAELVAIRPTLRAGGAPCGLHLALEFYTLEEPSADDLAFFAETAELLLESGWGLNYEFVPPSDYHGCRVAIEGTHLGTTTRAMS